MLSLLVDIACFGRLFIGARMLMTLVHRSVSIGICASLAERVSSQALSIYMDTTSGST